MVSFTPWLSTTGETPPVPLNRQQAGLQSRSGHFAEAKSLLTLPGIETHIHGCPSRSPASIPTEPFRFLQLQMCAIPSSPHGATAPGGPGPPHYRGLQRLLPDNTRHSQETDIHAPGGIRTRNTSKRAAADECLRLPSHRDRSRCSQTNRKE